MKQHFTIIALGLMAIALVYLRFTASQPTRTQMRVGNTTIAVEIADTVGKQRQGLSGRDSIAADQGMYFPMGQLAIHSFWMKDMRFPLDIIWIRAGQIVDISENVPYPYGDHAPVVARPKEPADAVLEVNADFTEKHGVKVGNRIELLSH